VNLDAERDGGDCNMCSFVAFDIELGCKGKVRDGSGCILVTFHMMKLCWER